MCQSFPGQQLLVHAWWWTMNQHCMRSGPTPNCIGVVLSLFHRLRVVLQTFSSVFKGYFFSGVWKCRWQQFGALRSRSQRQVQTSDLLMPMYMALKKQNTVWNCSQRYILLTLLHVILLLRSFARYVTRRREPEVTSTFHVHVSSCQLAFM